jgi:hypothetical protein
MKKKLYEIYHMDMHRGGNCELNFNSNFAMQIYEEVEFSFVEVV